MEWFHLSIQAVILFSGLGIWIAGIILYERYKHREILFLYIAFISLSLGMALQIFFGMIFQIDSLYSWFVSEYSNLSNGFDTIIAVLRILSAAVILFLALFLAEQIRKKPFRIFLLSFFIWNIIDILSGIYFSEKYIETIGKLIYSFFYICSALFFMLHSLSSGKSSWKKTRCCLGTCIRYFISIDFHNAFCHR